MSREQICQQILSLTHIEEFVLIRFFFYFILDRILLFDTGLIMSKIPFGSLLASRSKTDHAKQLKDLFTVIENEQDKEKKHYEDVN